MSDEGKSGANPPRRSSDLVWLCADLVGLGWEPGNQAEADRLNKAVTELWNSKPVWNKSGSPAVKKEIASIRRNIKKLIGRIEALDKDAKELARAAARNPPERKNFEREIREAIQNRDQEKREQLQPVLEYYMRLALRPVDHAAIGHLRALEAALQVAEKADVRSRNEWAYRTALIAVRFYRDIKGEKPGYYKGKEGPFTRSLSKVWAYLGIKAGLEGPVLEALDNMDNPDVPDPGWSDTY